MRHHTLPMSLTTKNLRWCRTSSGNFALYLTHDCFFIDGPVHFASSTRKINIILHILKTRPSRGRFLEMLFKCRRLFKIFLHYYRYADGIVVHWNANSTRSSATIIFDLSPSARGNTKLRNWLWNVKIWWLCARYNFVGWKRVGV